MSASPTTAPRRWTDAAGAWLGLGAAPAALIMGAGMADRNGGALPLVAVLCGAVLMALLLFGQGALGVRPPYGEGATLTEVAPRYLHPSSRPLIGLVLGIAMIGWNGFNVGLGGASLAAVTGLPGPVAALLLAATVIAASFASPRLGNRIAVLTTLSALALVALCLIRLRPDSSPVTAGVGGLGMAADVAAMCGYAAVFALRAPDFSRDLAGRRDLLWCVGLLVVPAALLVVAGAGVWLRTGSADVVAVLGGTAGIAAYGNLFVTAGIFAPSLTTTFSGALALRGVWPRLSTAVATLLVAVPGAALAAMRFDRLMLPWLTVLAAALPPLVVPMAVEAFRRRRGRVPRTVPVWTWLPAGAVAVTLTVVGTPVAALVGLLLAALATAGHLRRRPPGTGTTDGRLSR
ncbi:hypothetical protein AB0M79_17285 [Polymorphospora sp. NPDC051019]|uniref:hypothetical protein n=1 Tax=Polymorphospora sp. NPDC051019 TaxID=3155725 RepID=UPI003447347C